MKTVGIIAEYNPFHNGHAYQIAKAKELTGADYCIIIMSGNFVQRGIPAIMDKSLRTESALLGGADLVIELPVHYATASAEYFASGAVALLEKLGVTDCLCFGSECGSLPALSALSDALLSEKESNNRLKQLLKAGCSYPQAKYDALCAAMPHLTEKLPLLRMPNNILGIEYLKALKKRNSSIKPYTLSRQGADYHDSSLHNSYSSALAIRDSITAENDIRLIQGQIPASIYELMERNFQKSFPVLPDDFSSLLSYKLLMEETKGFAGYFDIDNDFSDRIIRFLPQYTDFTSFCKTLKSKNITYTKVSRNLLHILLHILQADVDAFCAEDFVYYARMLGFKRDAAPLLSAIKANSAIPLISKLADAASLISSDNGRKMIQQDILSGHVYALAVHQKFHCGIQNEYQKQIIVL